MNTIQDVAAIIEKLAKNKNETISAMLTALKLDKSTVSRMKAGSWPRNGKLEKIASYYGITENALLGISYAPDSYQMLEKAGMEVYEMDDLIKIPIYGEIKAGYGAIAYECFLGFEFSEYSDIGGSHEDFFYLRVRGDSMSPVIMNKDLVLIKKQPTIDYNGQIAAVIINDEGTLKKVYMDKNKIMLVAANERYAPVAYTGSEMGNVTIAGVVKELKRKL